MVCSFVTTGIGNGVIMGPEAETTFRYWWRLKVVLNWIEWNLPPLTTHSLGTR
jgi:hypothetical protein